eukprot:13685210-Alexandrium_andersonii.AAC.1
MVCQRPDMMVGRGRSRPPCPVSCSVALFFRAPQTLLPMCPVHGATVASVSYTHLTLPTICSV